MDRVTSVNDKPGERFLKVARSGSIILFHDGPLQLFPWPDPPNLRIKSFSIDFV